MPAVLRLRAPGLLGPLPDRLPPGVLPPLPALETWLARGRRAAASNLPEAVPEGPLALLGDGGRPDERWWSRAAPVFLQVEGAGVRLQPAALDPGDEEALARDLDPLFTGRDVAVERRGPGRWYLASHRPAPERPSPSRLLGRFVDPYTPRYRAAVAWDALLGELEMALHDHPVNRRREARGQDPVNAFWVWGCGQLPAEPPDLMPWERLYTDAPAWLGLARWAGVEAAPMPASGVRPDGPHAGAVLVVDHEPRDALAAADGARWLQAVERLEREIAAPALEALRSGTGSGAGRWDALELDTGGEAAVVRLTRRSLRRFWRRRRRMERWLLVAEGGRGPLH